MTEQEVRKEFIDYRWKKAKYMQSQEKNKIFDDCKRVETWLLLLTREERIIVRYHLIDGLDWNRTAVELEKLWGYENGRSERSLKRKQSNAIKKIVRFVEGNLYNKSTIL